MSASVWEEDDEALQATPAASKSKQKQQQQNEGEKEREGNGAPDRSATLLSTTDASPSTASYPTVKAVLRCCSSLLPSAKRWVALSVGSDRSRPLALQAAAVKRAQQLGLKLEAVQWQLRRLLALLDSNAGAVLLLRLGIANSDEAAAAVALGSDEDDGEDEDEDEEARLRSALLLLLSSGRRVLAGLAACDAPDSSKRKRRSALSDGDEEEDNDNGGFVSSRRKGGAGRGGKRRLRSRNKVVDDWLGDEGGADSYADLEDFLV